MLIDTSGFFAAFDQDDKFSTLAVSLYDEAVSHLTTNYVLAEYAALKHARDIPRSNIIDFSTRILDDGDVEIVWVDESLPRRAVELLIARNDKGYSICDAVSFVLMKDRSITDGVNNR